MSNRELRGTKRTCQNPECGVRFYDLMRDPITCPACGAVYQIVAMPLTAEAARAEERAARRAAKKPEYVPDVAETPADAPEAEGDISLEDLPVEDEAVSPAEDETFLEEEEDENSDVSGIIGGPGDGDDDQ
jgi:uncharacterized protein (TIGR02300 family)